MPSYWPIGGGASTVPVGPTGAVQFNNSGAFGGSSGMVWNPAGPTLTVTGNINATGTYSVNGTPIGLWTAGTGGAIYYNGGSVGIGTATPACSMDASGVVRAQGSTAPTAGAGIELQYSGGTGFLLAYDRGGAVWKPLHVTGSAIDVSVNGGGALALQSIGGNVSIGSITPTYTLQLATDSAAKPSTNTWTIASDIRTKRNVRTFNGDINVIRQLNPIVAEYNGLAGTPKGQRVVSFDAAELRKLVPPCVSSVRAKLREGDEEETEILGVNTHELFFHLLRAVQDIDRRLQGMEHGSKRK